MIKHTYLIFGVILICAMFCACEKDIFGPNKGDIDGVVYNNVGEIVPSVTINASIIDSTSIEILAIASSNQDGSFELIDVGLGEIQLKTQINGYREELVTISLTQENNYKKHNFSLLGAPEILSVSLRNNEASITNNESILVNVSTQDLFKSELSLYLLNLQGLVKNSNQEIIKIYNLSTLNTLQNQLFDLEILAIDFEAGTYTIEFNATDNDGILSNRYLKEITITN